jgi:hypothetical protein
MFSLGCNDPTFRVTHPAVTNEAKYLFIMLFNYRPASGLSKRKAQFRTGSEFVQSVFSQYDFLIGHGFGFAYTADSLARAIVRYTIHSVRPLLIKIRSMVDATFWDIFAFECKPKCMRKHCKSKMENGGDY